MPKGYWQWRLLLCPLILEKQAKLGKRLLVGSPGSHLRKEGAAGREGGSWEGWLCFLGIKVLGGGFGLGVA